MNNLYRYFNLKNKKINCKLPIYCKKRKKYLIFTYEEYIRQKVISYLIFKKGYPIHNIYLEIPLYFSYQIFYIDILIKKKQKPYCIIECKTPFIKINNNNLNQLLLYGTILKIKYYYLTNYIDNIIFKIKNKKLYFLKDIPNYNL